MTGQGSPLARYRRALRSGNPDLAIAIAHELPRVGLDDALALVMLLRGDRRYERAAVRWVTRFLDRNGGAHLDEASTVIAALIELGEGDPGAMTAAFRVVLRRHGLERAGRHLPGSTPGPTPGR